MPMFDTSVGVIINIPKDNEGKCNLSNESLSANLITFSKKNVGILFTSMIIWTVVDKMDKTLGDYVIDSYNDNLCWLIRPKIWRAHKKVSI